MARRGDRLSSPFVAAAAAVALAGCADSPASAEKTTPAADRVAAVSPDAKASSRIPAGFRVRRVPEEGLSLALPRDWTALDRHDVVFPGVIRSLSRAHRSLTPYLLGLAAPDSPLKLLAFDGRPGEDSATMANVFVGPAPPGASFKRQRQVIVQAVRKLGGLRGPVEVSRLRLAAGEAVRLEYVRRGVATVQYATIRGDRLFALVYTTLPELELRYTEHFEASARTLSLRG